MYTHCTCTYFVHCFPQVCSSKVQPTIHEQSVITALNTASGTSQTGQMRRKKRKKPKGPNPLSVKKSHRVVGGSRDVSGGVSKVGTTAFYAL